MSSFVEKFKVFFNKAQSANDLLAQLRDPDTLVQGLVADESSEDNVVFIEYLVNATLPCMVNQTQENISESVDEITTKIVNNW